MNKIKLLRAEVYEKIAAGEVIDRPVSVVKELVENSLDAGASQIEVEVVEGGRKMIRVSDNGCGLDREEVDLAFQRHATSKLTQLADFDSLQTLGFRGEALPSILAVSNIIIVTADNTLGQGIRCVYESAKKARQEEVACTRGTSIEVRDLFYNYPVRQKFLKSSRSELSLIGQFLEQMAMLYHQCRFSLTSDTRQIFVYHQTESLGERLYQIFGKEFLDQLQEVNYSVGQAAVNGFISRINTGLTVKKHQYFFVNRRPVREKTLISALNNTFQNYLEKSKSPVAVLNVLVPMAEVDVNIHPQKREVRFRDSSFVYQLIRGAVEGTIHPDKKESPSLSQGLPSAPPSFFPTSLKQDSFYQEMLIDQDGRFLGEEGFRIIGQLMNSYVLIEKDLKLMLVDQHNAQERIHFDRLFTQYREEGRVPSILPLFPIILELTSADFLLIDRDKEEQLQKLGFEVVLLSGNSLDIKKFPQILPDAGIKEVLVNILHADNREADFAEKVLADIACKSSIKVNQRLSLAQMHALIESLLKSENPFLCPHRRPIVVSFDLPTIEKLFKRK